MMTNKAETIDKMTEEAGAVACIIPAQLICQNVPKPALPM